MTYRVTDLMIGTSRLQKIAMACFILGKLMMPATVCARLLIGEKAGFTCLGIYSGLIVACILICLYDRFYYVPYVEEDKFKKLTRSQKEKRITYWGA